MAKIKNIKRDIFKIEKKPRRLKDRQTIKRGNMSTPKNDKEVGEIVKCKISALETEVEGPTQNMLVLEIIQNSNRRADINLYFKWIYRLFVMCLFAFKAMSLLQISAAMLPLEIDGIISFIKKKLSG